MSKDKTSTSVTSVACESKLRSVLRSSVHPRPGNWVSTGRAVVSMSGMPMHLVHALNVCTVPLGIINPFDSRLSANVCCQIVFWLTNTIMMPAFNGDYIGENQVQGSLCLMILYDFGRSESCDISQRTLNRSKDFEGSFSGYPRKLIVRCAPLWTNGKNFSLEFTIV